MEKILDLIEADLMFPDEAQVLVECQEMKAPYVKNRPRLPTPEVKVTVDKRITRTEAEDLLSARIHTASNSKSNKLLPSRAA